VSEKSVRIRGLAILTVGELLIGEGMDSHEGLVTKTRELIATNMPMRVGRTCRLLYSSKFRL
jgi:hypothetical protein